MPEPKDIHVDAVLSQISLQYRNEALIWDQVLPPLKVNKRSDVYYIYNKDERFRIPSDAIGPKSQANEVDYSVTTGNYSVKDHALSDFVSRAERDNADQPLNPDVDAAEFISNLLWLAQEKRVADLAFVAASYPVGNKVTLSGTDQWNDETNSNPLDDILTGLDAAFIRPNVMVLGGLVFTQIRKHPKILDAIKGRTGVAPRGGIVSAQDLADLFEISKVLIGRSKYNTARKGQTASYAKLWGKHSALLHVVQRPSVRSITFGLTFQEMQMQTQRIPEPKRGIKGGDLIITAWNTDEKIVASDVGYFIENAIA